MLVHRPRSIPTSLKIDEYETKDHYKSKKIRGAPEDKYIEYKSSLNVKILIEQYLEQIILYLGAD